jgi:FixJ family two-component response regulator
VTAQPLVYVVDDDADVRDSLRLLLESVGIEVAVFSSADDFLAREEGEGTDRPGCLLLDVRMPGMGGIALLEHMRRYKILFPTIVITGHGDIPMAVRAMKLGAVDFVSKPYNHQVLLDMVQETLRRMPVRAVAERVTDEELIERWRNLTEREQQVFWSVVRGAANKVIALDLGISIRTVEAHRARIMKKMQVRKLADLVLFSVRLERLAQDGGGRRLDG